MVLRDNFCKKCGKAYTIMRHEWCSPCQTNYLKKFFTNHTSGNQKIDDLIQEMQSKINEPSDKIFEWIPYDQFNDIKKVGEGRFAIVYSAIWKNGPLRYDIEKQEYTRNKNVKVALKCLNNSQIISDRFLNEVKAYPINDSKCIISIYGISQNLETKNYVIVFEYAEGGTLTDWMKKNYENFDWRNRLTKLTRIILGLEEIHQKEMIHRDLHAGNILLEDVSFSDHDVYDPDNVYVSDMGLSGQVNDTDEINKTKIYGVLPYVAPEVLNEKPYTQASDIYSLGMIMYFIATGRPPFDGRKHDEDLANRIMSVDDFRPEINEQIVPKCYIDLMKRCWDSNADNRPSATEVKEMISVFYHSYTRHPEYKYLTEIEIEKEQSDEIKAQFELAELIREEYTYYSSTNNDNQNNHPDHDNDDNNNDDDNNDDDNNDDNNNDDNDVSDPSAFVQAIADEVVPNNNNVSDPLAIEQAIADEIVPYNIG
ncbi:kinase-like domain-containing protein [Rhizophagus irregularis DAOM 181602=DAOM 197198]|uniref:Kinase-like domain-containing protein n=1 Tax=Rhizophagus irregularis (strain DAOM 181602 / DAOM 197198 / MUCL 43194) TaxID=747089 RepID=A0A2P4PGL1_RHIID|nr:kinase-like domain-containing protein [Rhizophagus irregularis DAOM 181602=DAOM 197198]POG64521.1 kinase-like domain-containing protein [Rhizophagus irregularis DAOM 181602=DAOM 197198]|eukprot:XP_025171387.1 kinase-like domain-containing protein [Rhizophagus irregularis DAOM 181602=DAOM 197198]